MSLTGNVATLSQFSSALRRLPVVVAQKVATAAAPVLTSLVADSFDAGEDPYGNAWIEGSQGQRVTLRKSGNLAKGLQYVATGTKLRMRLPVAYAKYQVGKRPVAPAQGSALPVEYSRALARTAVAVCREELGR